MQACGDPPPPAEPVVRPVRYVTALATGGQRTRTFSGVAQAGVESALSFRVPGAIVRLDVEVGDRVAAGGSIARLDPVDYELQVREAEASLRQAEARAENAAADLRRVRTLYENDNAARTDLDAAGHRAYRARSSRSVCRGPFDDAQASRKSWAGLPDRSQDDGQISPMRPWPRSIGTEPLGSSTRDVRLRCHGHNGGWRCYTGARRPASARAGFATAPLSAVTRETIAGPPASARAASRHQRRAADRPDAFSTRFAILARRHPRSPTERADLQSEALACEPRDSHVSSGPALVAYLRSLPEDTCINVLFDGPEDMRLAAFRQGHVLHVIRAAATLSLTYDGTNATNLSALFYFLRAAYYNEFYYEEIRFSSPDVDQAMVDALDAFIKNARYHDITNEHGLVLSEVFVVLDSFGKHRRRYLPVVRDWLAGFDARHTEHKNLLRAANNLLFWVYRGQQDEVLREAVDTRLVHVLADLAVSDSLLDDARHYKYVQILLANAALVVADFLLWDYSAPIIAAVQHRVQRILARYDPLGENAAIWIGAAESVYYADACADFDICDARNAIERAVLSIDYPCGDVRFRTQSMTPAGLTAACGKLAALEPIFHEWLRTRWEPVADDFNSSLEVVVYEDWDNYDLYSGFLFGHDTDNGGIYLEGDPSDPANTARFLGYVAHWLPEEPVWNLEHEYVHYLDGRFNMAGSFQDYKVDTHKTLWWVEGLAEYISNRVRESVVEYPRPGCRH